MGIHLIISAQRCQTHDLTEWRQSHHHLRSIKKNYRLIQTLKHSTSKDEAKREAKQDEIKEAYQVYIDQAQRMVHRAHATCQLLKTELKELLDLVVLPKKGRLSEADKIHEYSPEFVQLRRQHSAVESAINALGVQGLNVLVMKQIVNNSTEQAMLGDFNKTVDDAVMDSGEAHNNQMMQLLSNLAKAADFARVVFDLLKLAN